MARAEAVLRRSNRTAPPPRLEFGDLVIDTASREVTIGGSPVRLTAKEFDLLRFLAQSPRQVFTRAQLLHHVWDSLPGWQTEATVNEHIHRLRRKVEADPRGLAGSSRSTAVAIASTPEPTTAIPTVAPGSFGSDEGAG